MDGRALSRRPILCNINPGTVVSRTLVKKLPGQ